MANKIKITPVLMAGGSGTRLWPMSRAKMPKQFLSLLGKNTMLQQSIKRFSNKNIFEEAYILTNESHSFLVSGQCHEIGVKPKAIFLEPLAKNTSIAIALAALYNYRKDPASIILLAPSDHIILKEDIYIDAISSAIGVITQGKIVTFGIRPHYPETGYGYINIGEKFGGEESIYEVKNFVEKPNKELALKYLESKEFLWNGGIFMAQASVIIDELEKLSPDIISAAKDILETAKEDNGFISFSVESFKKAPAISFDYALMEKTDKAVVIPVNIGWSDIGSWQSLSDKFKKDLNKNYFKGSVVENKSKNNTVFGGKRLVALQGVENLIVVDTPDVLLIANREDTANLKPLIEKVLEKFPELVENHTDENRQWGHYEVFDDSDNCKVKKLVVAAGKKLSYQSHKHRNEHWFIVSGEAKIILNGKIYNLKAGESIDIPAGTKHRIENITNEEISMIEVQTGSYFGEDDIERYACA